MMCINNYVSETMNRLSRIEHNLLEIFYSYISYGSELKKLTTEGKKTNYFSRSY
jgi:hypothetical protein